MTECDIPIEELFLILYCIVDDLYQETAPDRIRFRNGADRIGLTAPEVVTLSTGAGRSIAGIPAQRLGVMLPSSRLERLSPPVSRFDLPLPISSWTEGPNGHPARDAPQSYELIAL
jgi:hypothetical protein